MGYGGIGALATLVLGAFDGEVIRSSLASLASFNA